jgi:terminal uridylyltransferase
MAVATQHSVKAPRHVSHSHSGPAQPRPSRQRFVADLSQCLFDFVIQLLPTAEELAVKEDVRKLLERLIRTIEPHSCLFSFGSTANGFSLRNSGKQPHISRCHNVDATIGIDMDLCCLINSEERLSATDLVTMLGDLLERGMLHTSLYT